MGADGGRRSWLRVATRLAACGLALGAARGAAARTGAGPDPTTIDGPLPRRDVLDLALEAQACGRALGLFSRPLLSVIDYSLPSQERRLWVLDLARRRVLFHEWVAHGRASGLDRAEHFSNETGSRQSSLGLFRAQETYEGRHGHSLRLDGLEPGVNDRARERALVVHGADYVSEPFLTEHGRLGRSWGCPAVAQEVHRPLIDAIAGGSALVAYYPDSEWLARSPFLRCEEPGAQQPPALESLLPPPLRALRPRAR
jgi:hypothetical protein